MNYLFSAYILVTLCVANIQSFNYSAYIDCNQRPLNVYYRNPYDCNGFYRCYQEGNILRYAQWNCQPNQIFEEEDDVRSCVPESDYNSRHDRCINKPLPTLSPTTQEPSTTPEPTTKPPTTPEPSTKPPTTPEPTTKTPSTPEPSTEPPTTPEPSTEQPTTKRPKDIRDLIRRIIKKIFDRIRHRRKHHHDHDDDYLIESKEIISHQSNVKEQELHEAIAKVDHGSQEFGSPLSDVELKAIIVQESKKQVNYTKLIKCPEDPTPTQYKRNPYDCSKYYLCYKQGDLVRLALWDCPDGQFFDDSVNVETCLPKELFFEKYGECKTIPVPDDDDDDDDRQSILDIIKKIIKKIIDHFKKHRHWPPIQSLIDE